MFLLVDWGDLGTQRNPTGWTQEDILHLGSYSNAWSQLIIFWEKWDIGFEKKIQKFYANPVCNNPAAGPALL